MLLASIGFQQQHAKARVEARVVFRLAREHRAEPAEGQIDLQTVVEQVKPTVLIGTSTVAGAFTQAVVETMARHRERPLILPLSHPVRRQRKLGQRRHENCATRWPFPPAVMPV
ncbi:MAG: hypothetical protein FJ049_02265 [Cyanobacteria bacterium M_surface_7_m2_037]|nr:hypothetical protein [Cyanobacteria bacterium M_surface_7_m2_037]